MWILLSVLLISGTALMGWLYYLHVKNLRVNDDQYRIVALIQKNSQNEYFKTMYLAELLNLSLDQPVNIYKFDEIEGEEKLRASPLIKRAEIKKIRPGTLYIDYQIRIPIAYLGNYTNAAFDNEGHLFPFRPFFTPKALPTINLSEFSEDPRWGMILSNNEEFGLALQVLEKLESVNQLGLQINKIDVSQAFVPSLGQRQIVVVLEEQEKQSNKAQTHYLRLDPINYVQNIHNYMTWRLHNKNSESELVTVDLRIPQMALIKKGQL